MAIHTGHNGIGRWTVEMMLMFRLGRGDVLPATDLGVRKGYQLVFAPIAGASYRLRATSSPTARHGVPTARLRAGISIGRSICTGALV